METVFDGIAAAGAVAGFIKDANAALADPKVRELLARLRNKLNQAHQPVMAKVVNGLPTLFKLAQEIVDEETGPPQG